MKIFPYIALLCHSGTLFTRPTLETIQDVIILPLTTTKTTSPDTSTTILNQTEDTRPVRFSLSSFITMMPLTRNPLKLKQKYFDDKGFSVDCAPWSSRASSTDDRSLSQRQTSSAPDAMMPLAISYIFMMNIITLWAALSLS